MQIFGHLEENGVEPNLEQKRPIQTYQVIFQIFAKKPQNLTFGTDLDALGNIQIFVYLDFWKEKSSRAATHTLGCNYFHQS